MTDNQRTKIIGILVIVLLISGGTAGVVALRNGDSTTSVSPSGTSTGSTPTSVTDTSSYKDGVYTATGGFNTPDGYEEIGVTLTIKSGSITNISIDDSNIYVQESFQYTERFISSINSYVLGKSVANASVSRVAGASLTSNGFNNALEAIKNDAKA